jgi:uncharacterized protein (DUF983 family)
MLRRRNRGEPIMLLCCNCPKCGLKKEYIAEQVGQTGYCEQCGNVFAFKANDGRVMWQILAATFTVLFIVGGLLARMYWQSHKYDHISRRSTVVWSDDD